MKPHKKKLLAAARQEMGFTLLETALSILLTGSLIAVAASLTVPLVQGEQKIQAELNMQTESLLFFHDLSKELQGAESIDLISQHTYPYQLLRCTVATADSDQPFLAQSMEYQYFLDSKGRVVRQVGSGNGYTILLQNVRWIEMQQRFGGIEIRGEMQQGKAVHLFEWTILSHVLSQ